MGFADKLIAKAPKAVPVGPPSLELPPHISAADAQLPSNYEQAKTALLHCASIDECRDWDNKSEALAAYAHLAQDETLRRLAERIQAHALRRCGELLQRLEHFGRPPEAHPDAVSEAGARDEQGVPQVDIPARLPATYEQAKAALLKCLGVDECRSWASREEALAAYARMAQDDTLLKLAERIQVRAARQIAEAPKSGGPGRPASKGKRSSFQAIAAADAGDRQQQVTAAAPVGDELDETAREPESLLETPLGQPEETAKITAEPVELADRPEKGVDDAETAAKELVGTVKKPAKLPHEPVSAAKEPDIVVAQLESQPVEPAKPAGEPEKVVTERAEVAAGPAGPAGPGDAAEKPRKGVARPAKAIETPVELAGEPAKAADQLQLAQEPKKAGGEPMATAKQPANSAVAPEAGMPPSRSNLAEMRRPARSEDFGQKHYLPKTVKQFADFCRDYAPEGVAAEVKARDVAAVKQQVATIEAWLGRFVVRLRE